MSGISLEDPYIIATLPRPLDASSGKYVCAVVHGTEANSRKRKREIAVGIDGEGVHLYDTSTNNLITSYALPPQSTIQHLCATKSKVSKTTGYERRTYVAITDTTTRIFMFKDIVDIEFNTISTTVKYEIPSSEYPIVFLETLAGPEGQDLLVVKKNGEAHCLHGDTLALRWSSPASAIGQHDTISVEYCHLTDSYSASQGLFANRPDVLSCFPEPIVQGGFNPDLLVTITTSSVSRLLHVLQIPRESRRSLQIILTVQLETSPATKYDLHATSGTLYTMEPHSLSIYDLKSGIAKRRSQINFSEQATFLRLTNSSVVACCTNNVKIYNPKYGSVQASARLSKSAPSKKRKHGEMSKAYKSCQFISYNHSLNTIYALRGSDFIAFQVDASLNTKKDIGCLIHAIGHGDGRGHVPNESRTNELDKYAGKYDIANFERIMADIFRIKRNESTVSDGLDSVPDWQWPTKHNEFKHVSEFWIRYAISKVFKWSRGTSTETPFTLTIHFYAHNVVRWLLETGSLNKTNMESALRDDLLLTGCQEIPAGQLIAALVEVDPLMNALSSYIANTLIDALELTHGIRALMQSLELFSTETPREATHSQALLTNGDADADEHADAEVKKDEDMEGEMTEKVEDEAIAANNELVVADYHLSDPQGSSVRGDALSCAIARLHKKPSLDIISALKSTFSSPEIIAFIYLLRFELARGSWTTRYLDMERVDEVDAIEADQDDQDNTITSSETRPDTYRQDSNIILITDLLNNCIDAFGSGGWLSSTSLLSTSDPTETEELLKGLNLEISAALQGIEEANFLKGLVVEMLRYVDIVQSSSDTAIPSFLGSHAVTKGKSGPIVMAGGNGASQAMLPLGLKMPGGERIQLGKVGAGGEVSKRTARDIGRLKSRKVPKYSRDRIVI